MLKKLEPLTIEKIPTLQKGDKVYIFKRNKTLDYVAGICGYSMETKDLAIWKVVNSVSQVTSFAIVKDHSRAYIDYSHSGYKNKFNYIYIEGDDFLRDEMHLRFYKEKQ